jgi:hypothetical protein
MIMLIKVIGGTPNHHLRKTIDIITYDDYLWWWYRLNPHIKFKRWRIDKGE